jgi:hypothetical protein
MKSMETIYRELEILERNINRGYLNERDNEKLKNYFVELKQRVKEHENQRRELGRCARDILVYVTEKDCPQTPLARKEHLRVAVDEAKIELDERRRKLKLLS